MLKAKQREMQRQLAKSLLQQKEEPQRLPVVPYRKDRMQLSQDVMVARALKEAPVEVHKRNPHTTYLSQLESFIVMINEVTVAQQNAAKTPEPVKPTKPVKGAPTGKKPIAAPTAAKKPLRKPASMPKSRMLPSGTIIIK